MIKYFIPLIFFLVIFGLNDQQISGISSFAVASTNSDTVLREPKISPCQSDFKLLSHSGLMKTTEAIVKLWVLELQRLNFPDFSKADLKNGP